MKKILKNRFFIVFIFVFLSFLFINNNSSKATYFYHFEDNDKKIYYTLPADCKSYVLFRHNGLYALLYSTNENINWGITSSYRIRGYADSSLKNNINIYRTRAGTEWNYAPVLQTDGSYLLNFENANFMDYSAYNDIDKIISSSSNVYKTEDGSLFFQPPQTILRKVMEVEAEKKEITTTLVGLARLLIPFLICLIGFWKAWHLLLRILQKA